MSVYTKEEDMLRTIIIMSVVMFVLIMWRVARLESRIRPVEGKPYVTLADDEDRINKELMQPFCNEVGTCIRCGEEINHGE